jgi:hypothetical protein
MRALMSPSLDETMEQHMSYVIYEISTTKFVRILRNGYWQDADYKTKGAATAAANRMTVEGKINSTTHAIAERSHFHAKIEKTETKRNLISGKEFTQPVNTPSSCDPSTETYWSM